MMWSIKEQGFVAMKLYLLFAELLILTGGTVFNAAPHFQFGIGNEAY